MDASPLIFPASEWYKVLVQDTRVPQLRDLCGQLGIKFPGSDPPTADMMRGALLQAQGSASASRLADGTIVVRESSVLPPFVSPAPLPLE